MKKRNPIGLAVFFGVAIGVVAGGVFMLQTYFEPVHSAPAPSASSLSTDNSASSKQSDTTFKTTSSKPSSTETSSAEPEPTPVFGEPLPKNADTADKNWFKNTVFVGDSLTHGLSSYEFLPESQVIASVGINPQTVLTKAVIEQEDGNLTVLEALDNLSPKKIYVMLGINGIAFLSKEKIVELYGELIDVMKEEHPNATIYIQSILPVTATKSEDPQYDNEKISSCNEAILEMTKVKQVYYVDVAEAFRDENGDLPDEFSKDGLHLGKNAYTQWLDYLLCHRVLE